MGNRRTLNGVSPLWLGIGISGSLLALLLVTETWLGRWGALQIDGDFDPLTRSPTGVLRDLRLAIVHCLLAGYLPAAFLRVIQSGRRNVLLLQDALAIAGAPGVRRFREGLRTSYTTHISESFQSDE